MKKIAELSDTFCAQILAYQLRFGIEKELYVISSEYRKAIKVAQSRWNIFEGKEIDEKMLHSFNSYLTIIDEMHGLKPKFVIEIENIFSI